MKKYRNGSELRNKFFLLIFFPRRKRAEQKIKWASGHGKLILN